MFILSDREVGSQSPAMVARPTDDGASVAVESVELTTGGEIGRMVTAAASVKEGGANAGEQKEVNGPPKSPWKKPAAVGKPAEAPVMGAESWPALDEVRVKNPDAQVKPALTITVPPPPRPPPPTMVRSQFLAILVLHPMEDM